MPTTFFRARLSLNAHALRPVRALDLSNALRRRIVRARTGQRAESGDQACGPPEAWRGAIGGFNYPRPTSQPASLSYWAALGAWGILRETDGRLPSRAQMHALLQSKHRKARDDDGQALLRAELPFAALPPRPDDWSAAGPTEFALLPREAEFLHRQFADLCPRDTPGHACVDRGRRE
jgi:hypothetical protein